MNSIVPSHTIILSLIPSLPFALLPLLGIIIAAARSEPTLRSLLARTFLVLLPAGYTADDSAVYLGSASFITLGFLTGSLYFWCRGVRITAVEERGWERGRERVKRAKKERRKREGEMKEEEKGGKEGGRGGM